MQFFLLFAWICIAVYQACLGYGTAYRLTKQGGDNGTALIGWLLVTGLAALVPVLGFYLWTRYKNIDVPEDTLAAAVGASTKPAGAFKNGFFGGRNKTKKNQKTDSTITCKKCGKVYDSFYQVCSGCGYRDLDRRNQ